jgi:shikimate 5-dehydrogenase
VALIIGATGALFPVEPGSWDILVNTTPVGMYPNVNETPFQGRFDGRIVYDLVYNPLETMFLEQAASAGCETIGGLEMLVAQAEDQSEWWIGRRPPVGLMREVALRAVRLKPDTTVANTKPDTTVANTKIGTE